ncbi:MAG TPA: TssQ family T6SS-associated lipoprotein [Noviherbaspirillum sp.]|jgi:tetratricopeptide (TPR) repeat protein|uniref:TssQ family T6SS-associated lipoprotein n=1 Tax=Noviherbaspirillum sp. TaxID=1926288 RepID=UPI002F9545A9
MHRMKLAGLLLAAFLAGCAQVSQLTNGGSAGIPQADAQSRYEQGLKHYRENRYDAALADLNAAIAAGQLSGAALATARKHLAFIHCISGRELQCREQFQALLKEDPDFDLAANEAGHPQWGPVWRSAKGASEQQRAVSRAGSFLATAGQQKLAEGIKEYEAGRYKESLAALQAALHAGLPDKADEVLAHKYSAFVYCLTSRSRQCRAEFRQLLAKDAAFALLPSEAGHPAWAGVYRSEMANSRKKAAGANGTARPAQAKK